MTGADDPDNRKPIWWPEFTFENESYILSYLIPNTKTQSKTADYSMPVKANTKWANFLKELIALRNQNEALRSEKVIGLQALSENVIQYSRISENNSTFILIFNNSATKSFKIDAENFKGLKMLHLVNFKSGSTLNKNENFYEIMPKDVLILKKI